MACQRDEYRPPEMLSQLERLGGISRLPRYTYSVFSLHVAFVLFPRVSIRTWDGNLSICLEQKRARFSNLKADGYAHSWFGQLVKVAIPDKVWFRLSLLLDSV